VKNLSLNNGSDENYWRWDFVDIRMTVNSTIEQMSLHGLRSRDQLMTILEHFRKLITLDVDNIDSDLVENCAINIGSLKNLRGHEIEDEALEAYERYQKDNFNANCFNMELILN
jgi:hypothetical protein